MKRWHKKTILLLSACLLLSGCGTANIQEDAMAEDLPMLDPQAGVARETTLTRYYRVSDEPYLVGVTRNVEVRANERTEYAIIRLLLEGVPALANNVSDVFPEGTDIVDVTLDGGILYVTLSREFLNEGGLNKAKAELYNYMTKGYYKEEEYAQRLEQTQAAYDLQRRLGVYALVNTLTGYSDVRVLVLLDMDGTGSGVRLTRAELGMTQDAQGADLVEPMSFVAEAVVTPRDVLESVLSHLCAGEYQLAYPLFADDENEEQQKPAYAGFETELLSLGRLNGYTVHEVTQDVEGGLTAHAEVSMEFTRANGEKGVVSRAQLPLWREGDLYKVGYASYKSLWGGA